MTVACVAVDVVNADRPTASLAFLAGACEAVQVDYEVYSVNVEMLKRLDTEQYQQLYKAVKLGTDDSWHDVVQQAFQELVQDIKKQRPDKMLISMFSYMQIGLGKKLLTILRDSLPDLEIIAGGPGISNRDTQDRTYGSVLLSEGLIDYYVLGEGDEVLVNWLRGDTQQLGLNSKHTQFESWVPQIADLDSRYLVPSYKKIDFSLYHNQEAKSLGVLNLSTSRGCVRACTFCDVSKTWPKFRFRSGRSVAQEVFKHWQDTGIPHFHINDSLINGSLRSFREFNQEMIALKQQHAGLADFSYNGMFIVRDKRSHEESMFADMAAAGCDSLAIGVETGSDRLRALMAKKFTNEDLDHHLEMCQKYGIGNTLLMFVAHPQETEQDYEQTLMLLDRYQKYLLDDTIIGVNFTGPYSLFVGTPDWEQRHETGIEILSGVGDPHINWINHNNPELTLRRRVERDLGFRRRAAELRYGIAYSGRYIEYLKEIGPGFVPNAD